MAVRKVYVGGKPVSLQAAQVIGTGGEADVYSIGGGLALKIYKSPDHPDLQSANPRERTVLQMAARERLDTAQRKLRVFPHNLPQSVLAPLELAYEGPRRGACIIGYTMPYLAGADLLYSYGQRKFREDGLQAGLTHERVRDVLLDLHGTVSALHSAGVVIGDFNDLNVLVRDGKAFMVDADSFQYGGFLCRTFQYRFVDPLICDPRLDHLELCKPHTQDSDWYAYSVMVLQCLLYVDPYAGLYRPKAHALGKMPESARPLHSITIFSPDLQYPRPAIPYMALPDDLIQHFRETFERDRRGEFPAGLLRALRWSRCSLCGADHARNACPWCKPPIAIQVPQAPIRVETVRGDVTATLLFRTDGRIVAATLQDGRPVWLCEQNGNLVREDGTTVLRGRLAGGMRARLSGSATHIAQGTNLISLNPGQPPERRAIETNRGVGASAIPAFAANSTHLYWVQSGRLYRDSALGPYSIGEVLPRMTRIWVGEQFGLGYYRSGGLEGVLLFDAEQAGLNDRVDLGLPAGRLLDATCVFGSGCCWFLAAIKEPRAVTNHCVMVTQDGRVLGRHSSPEGDGSWLGSIHGKCGAGSILLCATDDGVARVEDVGGLLAQTRLFPGTAPYVDSATQLLAGPNGLYAVTDRTIHLLRLANS